MAAWVISNMHKRIIALIAALVVPYLIFTVVIGLNQSDLELESLADRVASFDVEKLKKIEKPKPKPKEKPKRRRRAEQLPSIKPSDMGGSQAASGLSFGVPQFEEAEFAEFDSDDLLQTKKQGPMDKSSVDTPPKVVRRSPIVYPELARKQGVSGFVTMNVLINENGQVEDVKILDSKPEEIFDLKADSTIRRWQFEPATYNGKKVAVWATQKIVFKLN